MKVLLITFSDNADHQDTLFGIYEQLITIYDTYLLAIKTPKVPLKKSNKTWLVDCPKQPGIGKGTFNFGQLISIISKIRKEKFDIIYFESLHVWNVAIMLALRKRVRIYHVVHEVIPHEGDRHVNGVEFMNKVICKVADVIILRNQKYVSELINRYKVDSTRVKCLELWRRYPDFIEPIHSGRILFFGRINPYKGANNLLKIVRLCSNVRFDVIGSVSPQMKIIVDELAKEKNVHINNNYVSDNEMKESFINCDWVIVPYNSASQSGIIIDAYKYSRPVIAFNVGAIAEQVDNGVSGYLISDGNILEFANKINEVSKMDIKEHRQMCKQAHEYGVGKYDTKGALPRFVSLLSEMEK